MDFTKLGLGAVLRREVAALSMSGSTLIVAMNALMLKRTKLAGIHQSGGSAAPEASGGQASAEQAKTSVEPAKTQQAPTKISNG